MLIAVDVAEGLNRSTEKQKFVYYHHSQRKKKLFPVMWR